MTLVYLNRTVLQVPDVGGPVQRPLEPCRVRLGGGGRCMDDPCILKQDRITSTGRGRAFTGTPGTRLCQARGRGLDAWMTLVYLNRTVLQVPDVGGPVQRPLEPSRVWQRRGENQQSSQTQAGGLGFSNEYTWLFSCILI